MRILELEIHNVRGIRHQRLSPRGRNFVIWGPNGSGKSAVVDAVDFLLTGSIVRLKGRGTGDLSLDRHGHHIDQMPEDAKVWALVQLPGSDQAVEIQRSMAHPANLECLESHRPLLATVLDVAQRGQHVLTRRDILRFITAESSGRAQGIQELLNIGDIEDIRRSVVRVVNDFNRDERAAEQALNIAQHSMAEASSIASFNQQLVLEVVNRNRAVLGGSSTDVLSRNRVKEGLSPPRAVIGDADINLPQLDVDIEYLHGVMTAESQESILRADQRLRDASAVVEQNPDLLHALHRVQLTELGLSLLDDAGACPLCETPWPPGELQTRLEQRLARAEEAQKLKAQIDTATKQLADPVNGSVVRIDKLIPLAEKGELPEEARILRDWRKKLDDWSTALADPIEKFQSAGFDQQQVQRLFAPQDVDRRMDHIVSTIKGKFPQASPEQLAWDNLTTLETTLIQLEHGQRSLQAARLSSRRGQILAEEFEAARKEVLGRLYDQIRDRFVGLYRQLHGSHEENFTASLRPEEAGLLLEVDFYGRGTHPPHALHSEGHQDSMGLCLYLALAERITHGVIDLVMLDDVVMSVDAEHRRQVCHLLATEFKDTQFFITTHDRTWARQMRTEGIVGPENLVEFYNWQIELGPQVSRHDDWWQRVDEDLQLDQVPSAAAKLRRGLEEFFEMACDALRAQVVYRSDGRWTLGDFAPTSVAQLHRHLRRAKQAANSWGNQDIVTEISDFESTLSQVFSRTQAENWVVNAGVHYNSWTNFSKNDLMPVVEAFQDLCLAFQCSACQGLLKITERDMQPVALRCDCTKLDWNLVPRQ